MDQLTDLDAILAVFSDASRWVSENVLVVSSAAQILIVAVAFVVSRLARPAIIRRLNGLAERKGPGRIATSLRVLSGLVLPVSWLVLQWISAVGFAQAGWPDHLLNAVVSLLAAWIVIRLATRLIADAAWSHAVAVVAWSVAALNILGLLDDAVALLDGMAIQLGDARVSMLGIVKAALVLAVLLWAATHLSRLLERRIRSWPNITPSAQVLFGKILRTALFAVAIIAALDAVGIDFTVLAVFGGAVGLGVGFGLQKVVSNLISGFILLLDRSVKPGDVIAIGDTFGWINALGARCVSVITRDGTETLIPNEELISQRVENWSYSDLLVRQRVPVGISYESDVRRGMTLAVEAAAQVTRVLADPAPVCRLVNFGDNAVELELRYWINDPQNGVVNVRSEVLLNVWDLFHENGIAFPYPQRDLHIRSAVPVEIVDGTQREEPAG